MSTYIENQDRTHTVVARCHCCGIEGRIRVETAALNNYLSGEFVQSAFPDLSAADREFYFISNICPTCWDLLGPNVLERMS